MKGIERNRKEQKVTERKWKELKGTERNWKDRNVEVLLQNMTGYDKAYWDGLEQNGLQHDNMIWNVIDTNESDWYVKELNESKCEGFAMKHDDRWFIWLVRLGTEWFRMDFNAKICYETWWELTYHIGIEMNWMYCNMKFSIWNMMRGNDYDLIVNKWNGLKRANMILDGTEMGSPSSTWITEDVDWALEVLKTVYCAHGAAVEGLAD